LILLSISWTFADTISWEDIEKMQLDMDFLLKDPNIEVAKEESVPNPSSTTPKKVEVRDQQSLNSAGFKNLDKVFKAAKEEN
jgi:hypothetical protein